MDGWVPEARGQRCEVATRERTLRGTQAGRPVAGRGGWGRPQGSLPARRDALPGPGTAGGGQAGAGAGGPREERRRRARGSAPGARVAARGRPDGAEAAWKARPHASRAGPGRVSFRGRTRLHPGGGTARCSPLAPGRGGARPAYLRGERELGLLFRGAVAVGLRGQLRGPRIRSRARSRLQARRRGLGRWEFLGARGPRPLAPARAAARPAPPPSHAAARAARSLAPSSLPRAAAAAAAAPRTGQQPIWRRPAPLRPCQQVRGHVPSAQPHSGLRLRAPSWARALPAVPGPLKGVEKGEERRRRPSPTPLREGWRCVCLRENRAPWLWS